MNGPPPSGASSPPRLLVSAVEPSGDLLAAELVAALRRETSFRAEGIAGPALRRVGVRALHPAEQLAVNGVWEVLGSLGAFRQARAALLAAAQGADLALLVDGPDFHLPMGRALRRRGVRVVGYVSPQVWAWRRGRAATVARSLDLLLCLFPFEPALYARHGLEARFVGHPVTDRLRAAPARRERSVFAVLPGSREHEVRRLLPVFGRVAEQVRRRRPGARFRVGWAPGGPRVPLPPGLTDAHPAEGLVEAVHGAEAALVASGTATLELAVLGVPMVVAYQVHPSTYWAGRLLVRGVRHIALPNILAPDPAIPEHIQHLHPDRIAADLLEVGGDAEIADQLAEVRAALGGPGASERAAAAVRNQLSARRGSEAASQPPGAPGVRTPPRSGS